MKDLNGVLVALACAWALAASLAVTGCEPVDEDDLPTPTPISTNTPVTTGTPDPTATPAGLGLTISADPELAPAGTGIAITATLRNGGVPVSGSTVFFSSTFGTLTPLTATTANGEATVSLSAIVAGEADVCATFGSLNACTTVRFN